jgi:hypothetical protein
MVNLITDIQMAITHLILSQINSIRFKLSSSNIEVHPIIFSHKIVVSSLCSLSSIEKQKKSLGKLKYFLEEESMRATSTAVLMQFPPIQHCRYYENSMKR